MSTEFNQLLSFPYGGRTQIWIIGEHSDVIHTMNELCVLRFVTDRARFSPLIPVWFAPDQMMTILRR